MLDEVDTREKAWQDNAVSELDDGCPPQSRERQLPLVYGFTAVLRQSYRWNAHDSP